MVVVYYRTIEHTEQADMTPPTPKQSQKKKEYLLHKSEWKKGSKVSNTQYPIPKSDPINDYKKIKIEKHKRQDL